TSLHLREFHRFLEHRQGIDRLDTKKLQHLWRGLNVQKVTLHEEGYFEFLETQMGAIRMTMTEDGIILLSVTPKKTIVNTIAQLEKFYLECFSPALSYLFSLGAPLPKELMDVQTVYPILLVGSGITRTNASAIFNKISDPLLSHVSTPSIETYLGEKLHALNLRQEKKWNQTRVEETMRHMVFAREFERQLSDGLRLHREIWDRISAIRESKNMRYRDFPAIRHHLLDFLKTLSFVRARLAQMDDILTSRLQLMDPTLHKELPHLGPYEFENLQGNQRYVYHLWEMTTEYVNDTLRLLASLFEENTQRELNALKLTTLTAALTGFFGMNIAFPWEERWPTTLGSSFFVLAIIIIAIALINGLFKLTIFNRRFVIQSKQWDDQKKI
ncbi:MAG: CorA family divalent cation transporter, partial [Patescibacteria group bacterium]